jgi:cytochrome b561
MQAGDKDVVFFNWILPRLIDSNPELHFTLKDAHKIVATAFYLLFAMHMVGALVHHFVVKDGTLQRMFRLRGTL